ncbi:MAG TPA: cupin domain-containing protein [Dehalococcoidia bacterium]|nr:cupin domain-containing protein [Dehalococcoidia bacterium]
MADVKVRPRVMNLQEEIKKGGFIPIAEALAKTRPAQVTEGKHVSHVPAGTEELPGYDVKFLVDDPRGKHLIEIVQIAPGNRKYRHRHDNAETVIVFLEGEGEFYVDEHTAIPVKVGDIAHSLPGEIHGVGNPGNVPLRYLVVEGPMPLDMERLD